MKIGFGKVYLNPLKPVIKFSPGGHDGAFTTEVKDELVGKVMVFEEEPGKRYIHMSCPFGGVSEEMHDEIKSRIEEKLGYPVELTTCATHTHYGPSLDIEPEYSNFVVDQLSSTAAEIEPMDYGELTFCYQYRFFDKVGRSRISGKDSKNIFLETGSIYAGDKRLATMIIYSSHPTTIDLGVDYMSGAGPACLMRNLEISHPGEFFTYMIGAAGDISTRFTRKGQTYQDMLDLEAIVEAEVDDQLDSQGGVEKVPLDNFSVENIFFHVEHGPRDISEIDFDGELTPREQETIEIAKNKHKDEDYSALPTEIPLQKVVMGGHIFIFTPFELFSSYVDNIDKDKASLINIANGQTGYLSGPGRQKMSFEVISESISTDYKLKLCDQLRSWGGMKES